MKERGSNDVEVIVPLSPRPGVRGAGGESTFAIATFQLSSEVSPSALNACWSFDPSSMSTNLSGVDEFWRTIALQASISKR